MDICFNCTKEIAGPLGPNSSCPFCGSPLAPGPAKPPERFGTEILKPTQPEQNDRTVLESLTMYPDKTILESDPDKTYLDDNINELPDMPLFFAWLVFLDNEGHPLQDIRLTREKTILGKGIEADLRVNDDYSSKLHAIIHYQIEDHTFILSDLGSTNHTWLKGKTMIKETLADGDHIRIGRQEMIFKQVRRPL
jgi:hypothetical protein